MLLVIGPENISDPSAIADVATPNQLRLALFLNHFMTFTIAGMIALLICYPKDWSNMVKLNHWPNLKTWAIAIAFGIASLPVVAYSIWINLQIPLPEWAIQTESATNDLIAKVLDINNPVDLLAALLPVSLAAGLGEELIFRGILQGRVLRKLDHHLAIWIAAIAFSLIHFELAGFLPRMLLGAALGYTYYWSKSLWVPIVLHMAFNGTQVVAAYISGEFTPDTEMAEMPNILLTLVALAITLAIGFWAEQEQLTVHEQAPDDQLTKL